MTIENTTHDIEKAKASAKKISAGDVDKLNNGQLIFIDVRNKDEFEQYHLNSAINIEFYIIDNNPKVVELNKSKKIVLYCNHGNRSALAASKLKEIGYLDVSIIDGGIASYVDEKNKDTYVFKFL